MFWETQVDELQRYGTVLLTRAGKRWHATWQVLVKVNDLPYEHWPSSEGVTPAEAVNALWARFAALDKRLILWGDPALVIRWNGLWREEPGA